MGRAEDFNARAESLRNTIFEAIRANDLSALRDATSKWQNKGFLHYLRGAGVSTSFADEHGFTPVTFAARHGKTDALKVMDDCGVDLDERDEHERLGAELAERYGHRESAYFLRNPHNYRAYREALANHRPNMKTDEQPRAE